MPAEPVRNMPAEPIRYGGDGGIAPVDPMAPGSGVAPVLMGKPRGKDVGNAFCMGVCLPNKEQVKCRKPYVSVPVANALLPCPEWGLVVHGRGFANLISAIASVQVCSRLLDVLLHCS